MKRALILALLGTSALCVSASTLFDDNFNSYADGSLITVSGGIWSTHSGSTPGQVDVLSGMVNLTETESEDVNALISGGPYSSGVFYYGLNVNLSSLPSGTGGYFAHFKNDSTGFRARLFATTNNAAEGTFRLGINNGSTPVSVTFPLDLSLGSTHQAVVRYDATAVSTTLWVDSLLEGDPSVTATDTVTAFDVLGIALRQSLSGGNGMGTMTVDDLKVATTFSEVITVVPEPTGLLPFGFLGLLLARRLRRAA